MVLLRNLFDVLMHVVGFFGGVNRGRGKQGNIFPVIRCNKTKTRRFRDFIYQKSALKDELRQTTFVRELIGSLVQ